MRVVNLARRPFVNDRPVVRLAALLWVLGSVLLVVNLYSYSNYWIDSAEIRAELAEIEAEIEREQKSFSDLQKRFQSLDLATMNARTAFLNELIRDRTFPWSQLFEDLEGVLPFGVKLDSVRPELSENEPLAALRATERRSTPRRRGSSRQGSPPPPPPPPPPPAGEEVELSLQGAAKPGDAHLDFVDALFAHPSFREPNLLRESLNEQTGLISFEIRTLYVIKAPEDPVAPARAAGPGDGGLPPTGGDPEEIEIGAETSAVRPSRSGAPDGRTPETRAPDVRDPGVRDTATRGGAPRASRGDPRRAKPASEAGTPGDTGASGTTATGTARAGTVLVAPAARAQSPPPSPPGSRIRQADEPAGERQDDGRQDEDQDEDDRDPRFVEPDASDTARLAGAGGRRS